MVRGTRRKSRQGLLDQAGPTLVPYCEICVKVPYVYYQCYSSCNDRLEKPGARDGAAAARGGEYSELDIPSGALTEGR